MTSNSKSSRIEVVHTIESHMIPDYARVVFDWDNTLKIINRTKRQIESRVSPSFLSHLIEDKKCELYIISAIRPSRMNMDTLLMEVDRLGLRQFFYPKSEDAVNISEVSLKSQSFPWMREGNIIICGYDKAEAFLSVITTDVDKVDSVCHSPDEDQVDGMRHGQDVDQVDGTCLGPDIDQVDGMRHEPYEDQVDFLSHGHDRPVVFFDDEDVNIENFSAIVRGSHCFKVFNK